MAVLGGPLWLVGCFVGSFGGLEGFLVDASPPARGRALPGRLLALCFCGAVLALGSLPSLARADEPAAPVCPGPALEVAEEMPQPEREVRGLRNDVRALCEVLAAQGSSLVSIETAARSVGEEQIEVQSQLLAPLAAQGGLPVSVRGQAAPLETVSSESDSANFSSLEEAVLTGAETTNSDLWGIAGLFVGFLTLGALFRVVRP